MFPFDDVIMIPNEATMVKPVVRVFQDVAQLVEYKLGNYNQTLKCWTHWYTYIVSNTGDGG